MFLLSFSCARVTLQGKLKIEGTLLWQQAKLQVVPVLLLETSVDGVPLTSAFLTMTE